MSWEIRKERILRELGVRPASVSKYCVGVAGSISAVRDGAGCLGAVNRVRRPTWATPPAVA